MTAKTAVLIVATLLGSSTFSSAVANDENNVELARGKSEIHLVGFGKTTKQGAMFADIIAKSFKYLAEGKSKPPTFQISWVEDRHLLLNPLLARKVFDFGFAWEKPDCHASPGNALCNGYFFSQPVYTAEAAGGSQDARRTYHAIIAKSHPRARTYLYYLNSGLKRLHSHGEYEMIVARHGRRNTSQ